jgi:hypothetical protein
MSVVRTSLAAVLVLSFAAPAFADGATNSAAAGGSSTASSGYNPNQTVCRHEEVTGSRLAGPRVCHTRQEWAQIDSDRRNGIDTTTARGDLLHPVGSVMGKGN